MKRLVLLVEDDADVRRAVATRLSDSYRVVTANNGADVMAAARRHEPDAIVLDLGLPGGDGLVVLEWLRDEPLTADIPVVVVTGRDGANTADQAYSRGAAAFYRKPIDGLELLCELDMLLTRGKTARARVLVVEDDPDTRAGLGIRLRAAGYEVRFAEDAMRGITVARESEPDLIIVDLGLPGGGGASMIDRMRANGVAADVPIVVHSALDPECPAARQAAEVANAYLRKPASNDTLLETIGALT